MCQHCDDPNSSRDVIGVVVAVSDADTDRVVVSLGPMTLDQLAEAGELLQSEFFQETVRSAIADAQEEANRRAIARKALEN